MSDKIKLEDVKKDGEDWKMLTVETIGLKPDFIIYFEGYNVAINVHSQIMSIYSTYFESMFKNEKYSNTIIPKNYFKNVLTLTKIYNFFRVIYNFYDYDDTLEVEDLLDLYHMEYFFKCDIVVKFIIQKISKLTINKYTPFKEFLLVIYISKKYNAPEIGKIWYEKMNTDILFPDDLILLKNYVYTETIYKFFLGFLKYKKSGEENIKSHFPTYEEFYVM
jgi:hypothetical protein